MLRLADNPPMTLLDAGPIADLDMPWTVIYCRPRQEKALAHELVERQVPYFLPMILREISSGGRRRRNLFPLFKSYLFFAGEQRERTAVLKTNRVVSLVEIKPVEQDQFRREIASLEQGLRTAPEKLELHPGIANGAWVRVVAGPMAGVEGVVLEADDLAGKCARLLLGITIMGCGATVEIHPDLVEKCPPPPAKRGVVEVVYDLGKRGG